MRFEQVVVKNFKERPRLWVYTPDDKRRHPCIVIGAAGSPLDLGMSLSDDDRAEHVPYVQAGYIVVAYDISGSEPTSDGIRLFAKRDCGVANGKAAIDYALAKLKVDPLRIYAVGHSSAGTLALQLAAEDSRVRGCIAYAPVTDVTERIPMSTFPPDVAAKFRKFSPIDNTKSLRCPVMLFSAEDDNNVHTSGVQAYAEKLRQTNGDVDLVTVSSGGHYDSMLQQGIPKGIEWLGRERRKR